MCRPGVIIFNLLRTRAWPPWPLDLAGAFVHFEEVYRFSELGQAVCPRRRVEFLKYLTWLSQQDPMSCVRLAGSCPVITMATRMVQVGQDATGASTDGGLRAIECQVSMALGAPFVDGASVHGKPHVVADKLNLVTGHPLVANSKAR